LAGYETLKDKFAEFILRADGLILSATYSTGPIGRLDAGDALAMAPLLGPDGLS
jgi:hypothetical protein